MGHLNRRDLKAWKSRATGIDFWSYEHRDLCVRCDEWGMVKLGGGECKEEGREPNFEVHQDDEEVKQMGERSRT
jgi:hypothetical protein